MERITLNLIPKGITPICHASQYDTGRQIALDLMDDLQGYTLSDETIELGVCKPDGNIVTAAVEVTSGKTYVIIETTEQMTACEGDSECELKISKDGAEIGTLNFKLRVERDPLKDGIESDTEIHNLTTQIHDINEEMLPDMVAEEVANQYDSQNVIFDDHPTAGHGTGYVVKSENVPDELADLNDIDIDNPQANQALVYNPDTGKFENGEVSTVGSINDLDDVDTTGAAEGTSLVAKEENGEIVWKPKKTIIELTAAEYAALKAGGNLQPDTEYLLKDAPALIPTAEDIEYEAGTTVKEEIDTIDNDLTFKRISFVVPIDAIAAGQSKSITATAAGYTIPTGYKGLTYTLQYCYGSNTRNLNIWSCNLDATGSGTFIEVQNNAAGATTTGATITLNVLFAKLSRVSTT